MDHDGGVFRSPERHDASTGLAGRWHVHRAGYHGGLWYGTSPNNGDVWVTSSALSARIGGANAAIKPGACIAGMAYGSVSSTILSMQFVSGVISTVTRTAVGRYLVTRSPAASAVGDWTVIGSTGGNSAVLQIETTPGTQTTTTADIRFYNSSNALTDPNYFTFTVVDRVL